MITGADGGQDVQKGELLTIGTINMHYHEPNDDTPTYECTYFDSGDQFTFRGTIAKSAYYKANQLTYVPRYLECNAMDIENQLNASVYKPTSNRVPTPFHSKVWSPCLFDVALTSSPSSSESEYSPSSPVAFSNKKPRLLSPLPPTTPFILPFTGDDMKWFDHFLNGVTV